MKLLSKDGIKLSLMVLAIGAGLSIITAGISAIWLGITGVAITYMASTAVISTGIGYTMYAITKQNNGG